mmetsp:Transcript_94326/g.249386  ORF Transcript_94326/g.249386 Transcript_94326/m.249386 type:complete len:257 (-) Transcript_94326:1556-2326(-)
MPVAHVLRQLLVLLQENLHTRHELLAGQHAIATGVQEIEQLRHGRALRRERPHGAVQEAPTLVDRLGLVPGGESLRPVSVLVPLPPAPDGLDELALLDEAAGVLVQRRQQRVDAVALDVRGGELEVGLQERPQLEIRQLPVRVAVQLLPVAVGLVLHAHLAEQLAEGSPAPVALQPRAEHVPVPHQEGHVVALTVVEAGQVRGQLLPRELLVGHEAPAHRRGPLRKGNRALVVLVQVGEERQELRPAAVYPQPQLL